MRDIERICHAVALLKHLSLPIDPYQFHERDDARDFTEILEDAWPERRDHAVAERLCCDAATCGAGYILTAVAKHVRTANLRCRAAHLGTGVASIELTDFFEGGATVWVTGYSPPPLSLALGTVLAGEPSRMESDPSWDWQLEATAATLGIENHYSVWRKHLRRYVRRTLRRWGWEARDVRRWTKSFMLPLYEDPPALAPEVPAGGGGAAQREPAVRLAGGRHWRTVLSILAASPTSMSCPQIAAATTGAAEISHGTVKNAVRSLLTEGLVNGEDNNLKGPYLVNRLGRHWLARDAARRGEEPGPELQAGNPGHA
jgi:hypothetical protein